LLTPEILDQINQVVVNAGHELIKKKSQATTSYRHLTGVLKTSSTAVVIPSW
jgi:hypothetical protein